MRVPKPLETVANTPAASSSSSWFSRVSPADEAQGSSASSSDAEVSAALDARDSSLAWNLSEWSAAQNQLGPDIVLEVSLQSRRLCEQSAHARIARCESRFGEAEPSMRGRIVAGLTPLFHRRVFSAASMAPSQSGLAVEMECAAIAVPSSL